MHAIHMELHSVGVDKFESEQIETAEDLSYLPYCHLTISI